MRCSKLSKLELLTTHYSLLTTYYLLTTCLHEVLRCRAIGRRPQGHCTDDRCGGTRGERDFCTWGHTNHDLPPHCMHLPNCRNGDRCWYNHLKHSFELNVGQDTHVVPLPAAPLLALPVAPPPAAPLLAAPLPAAPPPAAPLLHAPPPAALGGQEPPCMVCSDTRADPEDEGGPLFCDGCGGRICSDCAEGEEDYCYDCNCCTGELGNCCVCDRGYPGQGYPGQGY